MESDLLGSNLGHFHVSLYQIKIHCFFFFKLQTHATSVPHQYSHVTLISLYFALKSQNFIKFLKAILSHSPPGSPKVFQQFSEEYSLSLV